MTIHLVDYYSLLATITVPPLALGAPVCLGVSLARCARLPRSAWTDVAYNFHRPIPHVLQLSDTLILSKPSVITNPRSKMILGNCRFFLSSFNPCTNIFQVTTFPLYTKNLRGSGRTQWEFTCSRRSPNSQGPSTRLSSFMQYLRASAWLPRRTSK